VAFCDKNGKVARVPYREHVLPDVGDVGGDPPSLVAGEQLGRAARPADSPSK
jgi:hypothetical protein